MLQEEGWAIFGLYRVTCQKKQSDKVSGWSSLDDQKTAHSMAKCRGNPFFNDRISRPPAHIATILSLEVFWLIIN